MKFKRFFIVTYFAVFEDKNKINYTRVNYFWFWKVPLIKDWVEGEYNLIIKEYKGAQHGIYVKTLSKI